ncbi:MAG: nicotinamide mononucleotide transporter [Bacteroidetes Order II. Incertae sedis bacterium]|nr:nicotinamide mononucleotide transporter [Bacteroidetes Order II. bacterium]
MQTLVEIWNYPLTWFEFIAFVFNLVCVYLNTKENVWAWPIGMVGIVFSMLLFFNFQLYGDFCLQFIFLGSSLYGWYEWLYGGEHKSILQVSRATPKLWALATAFIGIGWLSMGYFFAHIHDIWPGIPQTNVPYFDALPTMMSVVAQMMLARKIYENWHLWIMADVIYVTLFIVKELYLTALLYGLFIALCILGLREWKKSMISPASVTA